MTSQMQPNCRVAEGLVANSGVPCIHRDVSRSRLRHRVKSCATATRATLIAPQHLTTRPTQQIVQPRAPRPQPQRRNETDLLPVYVALESDVVSPLGALPYAEALKVGLKALRLLGVRGISVDVLWGVVEKSEPQVYNWSAYKVLFNLIAEMGFKIKVNLCFNSTELVPLPDWLHAIGAEHPDIWFMDKGGQRSMESLSVGVDEVPCLGGRTGMDVHADLMRSFRDEFAYLLGGPITEILIGLGPRAELRYPSTPHDKWEYPGVGEFQCYDRYMLGSLKACAEQVQQPPWGLGGPHDAGTYKTYPHQSGFFTQTGNWSQPYGRFFLQWYSEMLVRHAQRIMAAASLVFSGHGVTLNARAPACHWWYNSVSHAAELTAGYYNTSTREGYLQAFQVLARHGAGVHLGMAEARASEQPATHCSDPEKLLLHQRTVAAAVHLPVTLENTEMRFDEAALARIQASLFEPATHLGVEIPPVRSLVFNRMSDVMFETSNWQRFKALVRTVRTHAEDNAVLYSALD